MQAIEQSKLAKVVNQREIHLITYPTIKISNNNQPLFEEIQTLMNQIQVSFLSSRNNMPLVEGLIVQALILLFMRKILLF